MLAENREVQTEPVRWRGSPSFSLPDGGAGALIELVARHFRLPVVALFAPTRSKARIALARQVAMYLCHVLLGMSLIEVGKVFGRDRTTVSHACNVVEDRRDDAGFDKVLSKIEKALENGSHPSEAA